MAEDVVPRSELKLNEIAYKSLKQLYDNDTKELSDNIERLRAEGEELEKKLNDYKKFVGEIRVTSENHAVIIDTEHTEYIDKRVAEGLKNMAVKKAEQEVAREMLGEIDFVFKTMKMEIETHIGEAILENDLSTASSIQYGKDVICLAEKVLFEALKKYIGE